MSKSPINRRFFESTRGRIVRLLRAGARTVEELAAELELTDNAVRPHLAALERDGLIRSGGVRRGTVGKPAVLFELHPEAEPALSRAYAPVLAALLDVLSQTLSKTDARKLMRTVGRKLAANAGGRAAGAFPARARAAGAVLSALGGEVEVEARGDTAIIRGAACPLASAVARNSHVCVAVETLVGEIAAGKARERCDRSGSPRCCFEVTPD